MADYDDGPEYDFDAEHCYHDHPLEAGRQGCCKCDDILLPQDTRFWPCTTEPVGTYGHTEEASDLMSNDIERHQDQARAQLDTIVELHEAYEALQDGEPAVADGYTFADEDELRQYAEENALSVEVSVGWHTPGEAEDASKRYRVVLCTGGPHVEIQGELGIFNEPDDADIYSNDWFKELTRLPVEWGSAEQDALDWYVGLFYYGDS